MRFALPGSALVHAAIFGAAFVGFAWPDAEDAPPPGAVTVDIVSMSAVSSNQSEPIESTASENLVSSGAEAASAPPSPVLESLAPQTAPAIAPEPVEMTPQPVEPLVAETVEPVTAPPVEAIAPSPSQPVTAEPTERVLSTAALTPEPVETVAPVAATPIESTPIEQATPTASDVLEPTSVTDARQAPVPQTLSFERPSAPTPREPPPQRTAERPRQQTQPAPAEQAGNQGRNDADAAAAAASAGQQGGSGAAGAAEMARWESQVQRRLGNASRYPRSAGGATGNVTVRFAVAAGGSASAIQVVGSSGVAALDQAALDAVSRAAPFPAVPDGVARTVVLPLSFVR